MASRTTRLRVNDELRGTPHIRLIGARGEVLGILTFAEALHLAMAAGLDLVEVNPRAAPPSCKLLELDEYRRGYRPEAMLTYFEHWASVHPDEPQWAQGAELTRAWMDLIEADAPSQAEIDALFARVHESRELGTGWLDLELRVGHWAEENGFRRPIGRVDGGSIP